MKIRGIFNGLDLDKCYPGHVILNNIQEILAISRTLCVMLMLVVL